MRIHKTYLLLGLGAVLLLFDVYPCWGTAAIGRWLFC